MVELAERCNYSAEHAGQVARLALSLFDQTTATHGLGPREREWLEYAALLHDIGVHISFTRHHKHSYYLVKNGDLRGFEPDEVEVIALTARYHRRGTPKKAHPGYGELTGPLRRSVRTLSALLRLAEGLDRSHEQSVGDLVLSQLDDAWCVRLGARGDTELEIWSAQRLAGPLEAVLGHPIRFERLAAVTGPTSVASVAPVDKDSPGRTRPGRTRRSRATRPRAQPKAVVVTMPTDVAANLRSRKPR